MLWVNFYLICNEFSYRILQPSNYKSIGKLGAMGMSGVGNRLVGGGMMTGHRNSISGETL